MADFYSPYPPIGTGYWEGESLQGAHITGPDVQMLCGDDVVFFTATRATGDLDFNYTKYQLEMDQLKPGWPRWYCEAGTFLMSDTGTATVFIVTDDTDVNALAMFLYEDDAATKADDVRVSMSDRDGYGQFQEMRSYAILHITSAEVGRAPFLAPQGSVYPISFITNTETSCTMTFRSNYPADWDIYTLPSSWTPTSSTTADNTDTFTVTATVPGHEPTATYRPGNWIIRARATVDGGDMMCICAQNTTDKIRQMYVDHDVAPNDVKVPSRSMFVGVEIPNQPEVVNGHAALELEYGYTLPIYSDYRNPEENEEPPVGSKISLHQYGYAIDMSPIPDHVDPGKFDDATFIMEAAMTEAIGGKETHPCGGVDLYNSVHVSWKNYEDIPDGE